MTPEQLYQIDQRLYNGLPSGPWNYVTYSHSGFYHIVDSNGQEVARIDKGWEYDQSMAVFMAHARLDMAELLQEVQRSRHRMADLEGQLSRQNEIPSSQEPSHG
jgi:hypothetical protein